MHVLTGLPYGIPDQLRKLDLYRPETQHEPLPVIIDFHGGGLSHGDKQNTMCHDMYLAKYGFAVVNANYRLVPQIGFQGQLHDALDAIIWTNEHAHDYGMDTNALFLDWRFRGHPAYLVPHRRTPFTGRRVTAWHEGSLRNRPHPRHCRMQRHSLASREACMELQWDTMRKATFQR